MTVNYKGLINGNINPIDLVKLMQKTYGGDQYSVHFTTIEGMYQISFLQNYTAEQKAMRPWERTKAATRRMMSIFIDGCCATDYADITTDPMTYVDLGHSGDCQLIIDALVSSQGGYVLDECGPGDTKDEWVRLEVLQEARMADAAQSGKGATLRDMAAQMGYPVIDIKLSEMSASDFRGLPIKE
jgi:hypothetical protein